MILRLKADAGRFERTAAENTDMMRGVAERGRAAGAIHHAFYASDDGEVWVVDEWDDPANFEQFFGSEQENIGPLMEAAGVEGEPSPQFLRKLDTADAF